MVKIQEDLTGRIFGRLTVLEQAEDKVYASGARYAQWRCQCSCEDKTIIVTTGYCLRSGKTKSCGCIRKERAAKSWKKENQYDLSGEYGIGITNNTNKEFYFDLEDYDKIKNYCWYESHGRIPQLKAYNPKTKKMISMHGLLGFAKHDHENRNELDNRKENLRPCTHSQNMMNRNIRSRTVSGIIGVTWNKRSQKWTAQIVVNGKLIRLGTYVNMEDAIRARLQAEAEYCGEFATQRHLFEKYGISTNSIDDELSQKIDAWEPLDYVGETIKELTEQSD